LKFIDIHAHNKDAKDAVINLMHNEVPVSDKYFSIGMHPWYIDNVSYKTDLLNLKNKIAKLEIVAVGECGLDKLQGPESKIQEEVFTVQIGYSEFYMKPLIIHCVKAFNELIDLKRQINPKQNWIIHGFFSKTTILKQLIKSGCSISLGTTLLQKPDKLKEYLNTIPKEKLFFETDDHNKPIESIYLFAALHLGLQTEELCTQISKNFHNTFSIDAKTLA